MRIDTVPLDCSCGALNEVPFEETRVSHSRTCVRCEAAVHWFLCRECDSGRVVPSADAGCPDCAPVDPGAVTPTYRPWRIFAVPCPWCGLRFNYLRAMGEVDLVCPHCGRSSDGRLSWKVFVIGFAMLLVCALVGREVMNAARPHLGPVALHALGFGYAAVCFVGALAGLAQASPKRIEPAKRRRRR